RLGGALRPWCGIIPDRLVQLEAAAFDRLHHGVRGLGIVCHDAAARRPRYFATGFDHGAPLNDVVRASAAIPYLFNPPPLQCDRQRWLLTDGGISDPVPLAFARSLPLGATHVIVSDCRWSGERLRRGGGAGRVPRSARDARDSRDQDAVWIRPRLLNAGMLRS